jgi:3'-5' exoribonuclease 1
VEAQMTLPHFIQLEFLNIRAATREWAMSHMKYSSVRISSCLRHRLRWLHGQIPRLGIEGQLNVLGLGPFQGRQHCGIDVRAICLLCSEADLFCIKDARNISRILAALGERGVCLEPNSVIDLRRRWPWMGKKGRVREEYL